ncbi:hypothetical protein DFJ74DRAFT_688668 [Hyaloraphidium curvatum]|nr:hypothetical protein DFJ74DRAFT_688668 [Hyaloraphidium curvatum]
MPIGRTFPTIRTFFLFALCLLALSRAATAGHSGTDQTEAIDPATGLWTCSLLSWSTAGGGSVHRCVGACPGGSRTLGVGRRDVADLGECGTASCVRIPSLNCSFVSVVSVNAAGWNYGAQVKCRGNGTCTLFSDPWCKDEVGPAPASAGPTLCDAPQNDTNLTTFSPWCFEAYHSLFRSPVPESSRCSDLSHLVAANRPWNSNWTCVRSCGGPLPGLHMQIRRAGLGSNADAECLTIDSYINPAKSCAFYCDPQCKNLLLGLASQLHEPPYYPQANCNRTSSTASWCPAALAVALNGTLPSPQICEAVPMCPLDRGGKYVPLSTCVRSCDPGDNGHYFIAVSLPPVNRNTPVRTACAGPRNGTIVPGLAFESGTACSWFLDPACTVLAPGEPTPAEMANDRVVAGVLCPLKEQGVVRGSWCDRAEEAFEPGGVKTVLPCGAKKTTTELQMTSTRAATSTAAQTTSTAAQTTSTAAQTTSTAAQATATAAQATSTAVQATPTQATSPVGQATSTRVPSGAGRTGASEEVAWMGTLAALAAIVAAV